MVKQETRVLLVRHAEAVINGMKHIVGGRTNESPLTYRGIGQAVVLGGFMKSEGIKPRLVFSSPAIRPRSTAKYALEAMGLDLAPIRYKELQELDQGEWTGRIRSEVYTKEVFEQMAIEGKDFKAPGGESMNETGDRMFEWANSIVYDYGELPEDECYVAFTHGLAIRCLFSKIEDWSHKKTFETVTDNTSINSLGFMDGQWNTHYLNRVPKI